jgi:arginine/lysine/ornithine decarboxylase
LESYPERLRCFISEVQTLKQKLTGCGYTLYGSEPLKITIDAKPYGYTGDALANYIRQHNMEPEFSDRDYLVLMLTPVLSKNDLLHLEDILCQLPQREAVSTPAPQLTQGEQILSVREAMLSLSETLPAEKCLGRIAAAPTVGCPPAVPIVVCGEKITASVLSGLAYYGITECCVVKNKI